MATSTLTRKALRIGVICGGRLVREHILHRGERLALGDLATPEWVGTGEDPTFRVFDFGRHGCTLFFDAGVAGRLMAGGSVVNLKKLRADPSTTSRHGAWELSLAAADRGKISFEKITVLFQFIDVAEQVYKPLGEMDFRPRVFEEDPVFLVSMAMWAGMAAVLAVWVVTQPPREIDVDQMDDILTKLVFNVPQVDPGPEAPVADVVNDELDAVADVEEVVERIRDVPEPVTPLQRAQSREELRLQVEANSPLFTTNSDAVVSLTVGWGQNDFGTNYDELLREGPSDRPAGTGLREGVGPGDLPSDNTGPLDVDVGHIDFDPGTTYRVKPVVEDELPPDRHDRGSDPMIRDVVADYVGQLQYCYEKQIKVTPNLEGRVEIAWRISDGVVTSAWVVSNSTGNGKLADCVQGRIKRWKFNGVVDDEVSWPFVFRTKN